MDLSALSRFYRNSGIFCSAQLTGWTPPVVFPRSVFSFRRDHVAEIRNESPRSSRGLSNDGLLPVKIVMGSDQLWDELHEVLKHRHIAIGDDALASVNRLLRKNERVKQTVSSLQLRPERAGIAEEYWELAKLISLMTPSFGFCLGINKWSPF